MKKLFDCLRLFFIPIAIVIAVFLRLDITPFGENSIWYIDLPQQMTMFYYHLYDVFKGESSAFFTWNYGMGTSFWATIAYYLSSPLSVLILLFPRSLVPFAILMIWLVKVGLSAVTMAYLLRKYFTEKRMIVFIFSISYALMSYSLTYYFLPMWLDAVYLLPLIIAGVHRLLQTGRISLFLWSLAVLFFANFYISYMTGIFVFLYFVTELYLRKLGKSETLQRIYLFFKSVFLAFLFTAFMTIPTFLELRKNKYTEGDTALFSFLLNPLDVYGAFFNGTTMIQNLSVYAGVLLVLLVPLYFFNQRFPVKERVVYGLFVGFLLYSMMLTLLNMVWHVFEVPNGAHYRYAFVVSFMLILLAVKTVTRLDGVTIKQLLAVAFGNVFFLSLANKMLDGMIYDLQRIHINLLFLACFTFLLVLLLRKNIPAKIRTAAKVVVCFVVLADLGLNSEAILKNYIEASQPHDWYAVNEPYAENVFSRLQQIDDSFYRTKVDSSLVTTLNESLRYKYKGMSLYTSTGSYTHHMFLGRLGYDAGPRAAAMQNGIFLSDALLGFKYVVTTSELDETMYTKMFSEGPLHVYQVNLHLSLGYMVDQGFMRWSGEGDMFAVQNHLLHGHDGPYYEKQAAVLELKGLTESENEAGQVVLQRVPEDGAPLIETTISIAEKRELYVRLEPELIQDFAEKVDVFVNGRQVAGQDRLGNLISLGAYEQEELELQLRLKAEWESYQAPVFYTLNLSKLEKEFSRLRSEALAIKAHGDTFVQGEITVRDEGRLLFLSIPYDENWKVTVNGKEAAYEKVGNFIGIPLSAGTHTIHLQYEPKMIYTMLTVSALSLLFYLGGRLFRVVRNRSVENG